jgi:hypothetical protein
MNRQRLILMILLGVLGCSLIYSFLRWPRLKRVEKLTYQAGMSAKTVKPPIVKDGDPAKVRLDLLEHRRGRSTAGGRNIFGGIMADEAKKSKLAKIPLPLPPPPPEKPVVPPSAPVPTVPAVVEPTPLQRDMATFTFLGFLKKDNRKTIFISNGQEIFVVKKGDKVAGKYNVAAITDESMTISSLQDGGEILIPLVENKPLKAPRK